ncbi:MAG: NAD-dependent epimerase/dehydratase family protein, partial [Acidimicrobiales bacterium]
MSSATVAVVGAGGRLRRQVVSSLEATPEVDRVVVLEDLDDLSTEGTPLAGVATLVHLDRQSCPDADRAARALRSRWLVDAAADVGVGHVVVLSSAVVYGAWADNPVPLTEEAPMRPNPGADYAQEKAELERCWATWADDRDGRTLAVLRPALVVGDDEEQWLAVALRAATRWGVGDAGTPSQFVHVDDVASAVTLAAVRGLDGAYNVAPEGWLPEAEVQALAGTPLRPPIPPRLARGLARWCWSRGLGGVAPELVPYASFPWVVASDRLREAGWEPAHSGAETLMRDYPVTPWARLGAKPRRELALGGGVVLAVGVPVGMAAL